MSSDFVPVALKAALINRPPEGKEGDLYRAISRTQAAPQGICVANSAGHPLAWALSFENESRLPEFLDYAVERFRAAESDSVIVDTERFMRYPDHAMPVVEATGIRYDVPLEHDANSPCPGAATVAAGALAGQVVGRALDEDGEPISRTLRQEEYMESRMVFPAEVLRGFLESAEHAGSDSFDVPDAMARTIVSAAYMGQLDVNPLGGASIGGLTVNERIEMRTKVVETNSDSTVYEITGSSDVAGRESDRAFVRDGRQWSNHVTLDWNGLVVVQNGMVTEFVAIAEGSEHLNWGSHSLWHSQEPDIAHLMAGHPIEWEGGVRFGLHAVQAR